MNNILIIFLGGGIGSVLRYLISIFTGKIIHFNFPLATLTSNMLSCIILGLTIYFTHDKLQPSSFVKYFILIGFCGGLSTFSTFSYENVLLLKNGNYLFAIFNILLSIGLCGAVIFVLAKRF